MKCPYCKSKKDMFLTNAIKCDKVVKMKVCSSCGASCFILDAQYYNLIDGELE